VSLTQKQGKGQSVTIAEKTSDSPEHLILDFESEKNCAADPNKNYAIAFEVFCDKTIEKEPRIVINEGRSTD
jgi:hypothetical protein